MASTSQVALAQAAIGAAPLTLDQVMADPDWIGPPVEQAWWSWDGERVQYRRKREGETFRDVYQQPVGGGSAVMVDAATRAQLDGADPVYDAQRTRIAFVRSGDVFVRDLRTGVLTQVTRSEATESRPQWSTTGNLVFRAGNDWYQWNGRAVSQAAIVKAEKDPAAKPDPDDLRERQLALFETLRTERDQRDALREQDKVWRSEDASRAPEPVYLGDELKIVDSALSPTGERLLVVTEAKSSETGQAGKMPRYITESGYEEFEEVRVRVGRNAPVPQRLWLVDVAAAEATELSFAALPGIGSDPLAAMRKAQKKDPLKGDRPVRIETDGDGTGPAIHWSSDGRNAAVLVRAIDNKDRWIATVEPGEAELDPRHHLNDPAWINWEFNQFGWTGDGALWLLSEDTGYSHLYLVEGDTTRALTSGTWEVSQPRLGADGRSFFFVCNRQRPGDYEVCAVDGSGGDVREITALDGVENFVLSPRGDRLLVRHSDSYIPPQLAVVNTSGESLLQLTDTRTPQFRAHDWIEPEIVQVPSKHGAAPIWGKYYGPKGGLEPGKRYPIVMFVHGAGYLQNVHDRWPVYFREQMFHNLLVQQGYIVLDLDYRASEGYGRDWRTDIYRRMGTPELEDYLDGLDWLVEQRQGDRDRAGIYGGSYGGFMAFMALFKQPGVFKAGAALRPVTDWSQYNHEYTSNILNTPELDPEAYRISSPIEYADGLQDRLLIAHGMIDDNVFYKDSVMLAQRLIELRKDDWELASYPLERHGFVHSDSWYDEYRRIYEMFEDTLK
ncbi:MAG: prolyl oligopeptidase family serine peptidase [Pseudomonadota bacterium]|nr:prolyl oligopeptidase family serine peptidase [Pseudomonadota bacterium]